MGTDRPAPLDKAGNRLELIPAANTSRQCSACGHIDPSNRKSQAVFACTSCGHQEHADINAARNIARGGAKAPLISTGAAGHAVSPGRKRPAPARGGAKSAPVKREPARAQVAHAA
ncbi:MAG: zinc ribbon domain-containing protein [Actinomycetota bacterium]